MIDWHLKRRKLPNFIAVHWRGEYALWVSYWVIGFVSDLLAIAVLALIARLTITTGSVSPFGILACFALIWLLIAGVSVWQMVGTWRSANNRIAERKAVGKRAPWAWLAKVTIGLGWLQLVALIITKAIPQISEATRIALMNDPEIPPYAIRVINGTEAEISGGIKFGLTSDFEKMLNASPGIRVVHLDSVGGRIGEAQRLNTLIRDRGLDTYVEAGCLSACTFAFVAGRQRTLRKGAQLGFHRGSFAGEDEVDGYGPGVARSIYIAAGISGAFIDKALATRNEDLWRPSEAEVLAAGVVTGISDGDEFAIAGYEGREITRAFWDKTLLKAAPVYAALKQNDPKSYDEILDIYVGEAARGTPRGKINGEVRARLNALIRARLPRADDAALIDFGRLIVDQYRALQAQDEAACYRFASGDSIDDAIVRMIPAALTNRETALDVRLISSAGVRRDAGNTDAAWQKIMAGLAAGGITSADLQFLQSGTVAPSDYRRYCSIAIGLYQQITDLPSEEAASVLRELFS